MKRLEVEMFKLVAKMGLNYPSSSTTRKYLEEIQLTFIVFAGLMQNDLQISDLMSSSNRGNICRQKHSKHLPIDNNGWRKKAKIKIFYFIWLKR